jgi:hypothetical protein
MMGSRLNTFSLTRLSSHALNAQRSKITAKISSRGLQVSFLLVYFPFDYYYAFAIFFSSMAALAFAIEYL